MKIESPPKVGVGLAWTLRSLGWSIAPILIENHFTPGVTTNVATAAIRPIKR
ncbi:MAG: Teichoic acid linkage unit synthesis [Actinobacteria bacterium]|nr:Teichoic acid linkage unit synthesis [Actinomycetota bacterium]